MFLPRRTGWLGEKPGALWGAQRTGPLPESRLARARQGSCGRGCALGQGGALRMGSSPKASRQGQARDPAEGGAPWDRGSTMWEDRLEHNVIIESAQW